MPENEDNGTNCDVKSGKAKSEAPVPKKKKRSKRKKAVPETPKTVTIPLTIAPVEETESEFMTTSQQFGTFSVISSRLEGDDRSEIESLAKQKQNQKKKQRKK
jgi:hypothetical protein